MSSARKVIDWHKQGAWELAHALADLPEGRYVLVPENELDDAEVELTDEQVSGLVEALEQADRGEARPLAEVHGQLAAKYRAFADVAATR